MLTRDPAGRWATGVGSATSVGGNGCRGRHLHFIPDQVGGSLDVRKGAQGHPTRNAKGPLRVSQHVALILQQLRVRVYLHLMSATAMRLRALHR